MQNTKTLNLIYLFLIGASVGYFSSSIYENLTSQLIFITLNTALAIFLLNMAILFWGLNFRNRLNARPNKNSVDPLVAARTTALAFAASRTGALLSGFYLAVAIYFVPVLANSASTQRLTNALITFALNLWLTFLGLWLERICTVKQRFDQDDSTN